jgi:predicted GNAT family acetyltransferase
MHEGGFLMADNKLPRLTDSMIDDIAFAMEDQEMDSAFSIKRTVVVNRSDEGEGDDELLVDLPNWTSRDGFSLMREYSESCPDAKVRKLLAKELDSHQKGVFRRFKDCLAQYPELLSQWYAFKQFRMARIIRQWYGSLGGEIGKAPELFDFDLAKSHAQLLSSITIEQGYGSFEKRIRKHVSSNCQGFAACFSSMERQGSLIAVDTENELAGFLNYSLLSDSDAIVYCFYVEPSKRRQGLFSLLVEHLTLYLGASVTIHLCLPESLKAIGSKYAALEGSSTSTIISFKAQDSGDNDELEAGSYYL